jgi:phosphonate transport system permease protein
VTAAPRPVPSVDRRRLLSPWPRLGAGSVLVGLALALVYLWGLRGTQIKPSELIAGIPHILDFIRRLMPPAWQTVQTRLSTPALALPFGLTIPAIGPAGVTVAVPEVAFAIVETIQMAIVGTSLARNTSPHRLVYQGTRLLLNMIRAVPEIIIALLFVAAVGLGPFSGVLALSVGAIGNMGKLFAEAIEAIDPQQVLAVSATGASRAQVFVYGVVPQALPLIASYSLLVFESNIRSATILGIVGAGGVGFVLSKYMALFQYHYLMGAMVILVIVVTGIDRISDAIRRRLT